MRAHKITPTRGVMAGTAGMLLVAGLTGCGGDPSGDSPTASTRPSATLRTMPEWDEDDEGTHTPIESGTYLIPSSAWSVVDFTVTFPEGWTVQYGHVYGKNGDEADEFGFYAVVVDEIFADACHGEGGASTAGGPDVDDLVTALVWQAGGAVASEPVTTSLGGYPATRVDLRIPRRLDLDTCQMAGYGFTGLQVWHSEPADKYFVLLPGEVASVYVVDVEGERQVFLVHRGNPTSAGDLTELQTVLDSVHIEGASSGEARGIP